MPELHSKVGDILADYHQVSIDASACLSPMCSIVGIVEIGANVSVFAGTHIRGDGALVRIGNGSNVQENCCMHVSGGYPLVVGDDVTIGHGAILHGCTVDDNVLVGMGAIVMDGAHIRSDSLVAAGALVTQGKEFPARSLIMGSPARAVRELSDDEIYAMISLAAPDYRQVGASMLADGLLVHPSVHATCWPDR